MIHSHDLFGLKRKHHPPRRKSSWFPLAADKTDTDRDDIANQISAKAAKLLGHLSDREMTRFAMEADRYRYCYKRAAVFGCPDCRTDYYIRDLCRSRICERCGEIYRRQLKKQIMPVLNDVCGQKKKGYGLALLTLTVSSKRFGKDLPDRADIKRLYKETSKFFQLYYGKYKSRLSKSGKIVEERKPKKLRLPGDDGRRFIGAGWLAVIEVGKDNNNAHCHALIYGPIRQWHQLKSTWEKITGDSNGVDIRRINSTGQAVDYIFKYVTKPPVTDSNIRVAEYSVMIKGSRRVRSGGIFYNRFKLHREKKTARECLLCGARLRLGGVKELNQLTSEIDFFAAAKDEQFIKDRQRIDYRYLLPGDVLPVQLPN